MSSAISNRFAVGRPGWITGPEVSRQQQEGTAAIGRNQIDFPLLPHVAERNETAIGRPFWNTDGAHGRKCELQSLAAVDPASPKHSLRVSNVGDPLPVAREIGKPSGNSLEIRLELI